MIAATPPTSHPDLPNDCAVLVPLAAGKHWQSALANAITDPEELLHVLHLNPGLAPAARLAAKLFPLRVPRGFVGRMRPGDIDDPLLKQILPLDSELHVVSGYGSDPVGDMASRAAPGVLHKYSGRALLIATGACAVHCRYCFRRDFPYAEESTTRSQWPQAFHYLAQDPSIHEVILSGGDPLSLGDNRLIEITRDIETIPHIRRLRIHTRQPIVLPERIDSEFCAWLSGIRLQKVIVLHTNHANEIDASVRAACRQLAACGATLLNQTVLLAGVNDDLQALMDLSESLFAAGVMPYYLHLLDRVQGAAHFEVEAARGLALVAAMTEQLPGYLVPKLVKEIPGERSKTAVLVVA